MSVQISKFHLKVKKFNLILEKKQLNVKKIKFSECTHFVKNSPTKCLKLVIIVGGIVFVDANLNNDFI